MSDVAPSLLLLPSFDEQNDLTPSLLLGLFTKPFFALSPGAVPHQDSSHSAHWPQQLPTASEHGFAGLFLFLFWCVCLGGRGGEAWGIVCLDFSKGDYKYGLL